MSADNGGPAFPVDEIDQQLGHVCVQHMGTSLRDYFAAKAMQAVMTDATGVGSWPDAQRIEAWEGVARVSFEIADVMLKARQS